jgi:hypothetical protein
MLENPEKPNRQINGKQRTGFTFRGQNILLMKKQGTKVKGLVAKGIEKGMFPEEKKIEAATVYAVTGSLQRAAELSGVPIHTLRSWRSQDDFQKLLQEVWQENNEKIDAKFTAIIEKSLEAIIDRLDNGDFKVTPRGDIKRVPISAKELSLVQAINVDKRQLLRGLPTSRSDSAVGTEGKVVDRLEKLAETFENLARIGRKPKTYEITDAEVVTESAKSTESGRDGAGDSISAEEGHTQGQIQDGEICPAAPTTAETTVKSA